MTPALKQCAVWAVAVAVLLLAGCSQSTNPSAGNESKAAKEATAPPEVVTAKTAFWPMYTSARSWAKDFVILRLTPGEVPGFKNDAGKAAMWQAAFASPSLNQYRVYTYAIANVPPDVHKGVIAGLRLPWSGPTRDAMPIEANSFNIDSDAAYKTATAEAAAWLKKNPGKEPSAFQLGNTYRFQAPVWYLMWGDKKSGYVAYVDANTGQVLKK